VGVCSRYLAKAPDSIGASGALGRELGLWIFAGDHNSYSVALGQLFQNRFSDWMRVPEQHPCIPMATDQGHFRHIEAKLKETTYGFVPKIVEMEVDCPCT
jgi:hypothetical protein